jgi:hypothetical protein
MGCLAEGAIDGHVTDASSGAPLAATLEMTGTLGMTYTTAADASGYYTQTVLPDTYDVKASALDYHPAFASVVVTNGVATRDLALLPIPRIVVSPAALTATLYTSQAVTHTLWITNAGTGLLDFAVHELSGTLPVDLPWLAAAPSAGTVPAGVGMPLSVTFDAAATTPGVYGGALAIDSDDPAAPQVQVPVTLTVAGACMPVEVLSVTAAAEGCVVSFGAALSGTVPYTYGWDLGAAGTYTDPAPVVDFGLSGTWPYTLTVANCGGAYHDVVTGTVDVACAPPFSLYLPLVVREG